MVEFPIIALIVVPLAIWSVWIFRYKVIVSDFEQFGLNSTVRNLVGVVKLGLTAMMFAGIWYPSLVLIPTIIISLMMLVALVFHFRVNNPFRKYIPALFIFILCLYIVFMFSAY